MTSREEGLRLPTLSFCKINNYIREGPLEGNNRHSIGDLMTFGNFLIGE